MELPKFKVTPFNRDWWHSPQGGMNLLELNDVC